MRFTDKGAKSWAVYYSLADETGRKVNKRLTLDRWPKVKVAEARVRAGRVREQAAEGIDPQQARAAEEVLAQETANRLLFSNIGESYIKRQKRLKRGKEIESVVRRHLIPAWGKRQITDITRLDMHEIAPPFVDADHNGAAHKLQEVAKGLFCAALAARLFQAMSGLTRAALSVGRPPPPLV